MYRLVFFVFFILSVSACGSADDYFDDYDNIKVIVTDPPSPKDSTNNNPSDTIIHGEDSTAVSKEYVICSYKKYMDISPRYGVGQGGACYDKYFFQGYQNNAAIGIYNLESKRSLGKIDITDPTPSSNIHVNTINFGSQRFSEDDFFPLLYVSSGYCIKVGEDKCSFIYVYRIMRDVQSDGAEKFSVSLIQTIKLKGFDHWTEGIIDNDHCILWVKYAANGAEGPDRYASFYLPLFSIGDTDIFLKDHIVDFSVKAQPFTSSNQGHLYYNDRIFLVSGTTPTTQKLAFIVINTLTKSRELVIDLAEIGLRDEPENLFFYRDQLMIGYRNSIYEFNVKYLQ